MWSKLTDSQKMKLRMGKDELVSLKTGDERRRDIEEQLERLDRREQVLRIEYERYMFRIKAEREQLLKEMRGIHD